MLRRGATRGIEYLTEVVGKGIIFRQGEIEYSIQASNLTNDVARFKSIVPSQRFPIVDCHVFLSASPYRLCARSVNNLLCPPTISAPNDPSSGPTSTPSPTTPANIPQNISPRPFTSPARTSRYHAHSSPSPPAQAT